MILSFHPIIVADKNILCAGRDPGNAELAAIKQADAIILPQGCRQTLYEMAIAHCPHVFPDYHTKFKFPDKIGQADLFTHFDLPCPRTRTFASLDDYFHKTRPPHQALNFDFPFVFKFDWGGEGDNVKRIDSLTEFDKMLEKTASCEQTGQYGFLIQEFIQTDNRSLRVAVIGHKRVSYWRTQPDPNQFGTAVAKGAEIDLDSDPDKQELGIKWVDRLCEKTEINLAGIDLIFPQTSDIADPLFLEINYFFGRAGIGGSERFYDLLDAEVRNWLNNLGC
jgi:ribosomal protein S6--L-glutamate ligase